MFVGQNGTEWDTGKRYYPQSGFFGTTFGWEGLAQTRSCTNPVPKGVRATICNRKQKMLSQPAGAIQGRQEWPSGGFTTRRGSKA